MPDFEYIARNMQGVKVTGTVAAPSERDALALLSGQSLFPISVAIPKPKANFSISFGRRVSAQTMAQAYGQLAALLRSGVPLMRSLKVMREQSSNPKLREVLDEVCERVEDGETLAEAMSRHPRVFGEMAINMVRAGAEGGFLEDALERVSQFVEQQEDLKSRTMGALAYPFVLASIGTIIVSVLIIFFVPKFGEMFQRLREAGELPLMTDLLLGLSSFLRNYGLIFLAVFTVGGILLANYIKTPQGRWQYDYFKIKFPLFGPIAKSLAVARFCRVLGTLMKNGVPILRSIEISSSAAGNQVLSKAIGAAGENISSGQTLSRPLAACGHFPPAVIEMISVAEESNTLDTVLVEIADNLERRTFRSLDLMVRLLEPLMLVVMAGIVLCVVIALLMPMFRMFTTM